MAKKIVGYVKLQVPAGKANPAPPIGPALGQRGLNIMEFCKAFNAQTQKMEAGTPIPVTITAYSDRTFTFVMKTQNLTFPEAVERLAEEAGLEIPKQSAQEAEQVAQGARGREAVEAACVLYERALREPGGKRALDYLHGRGLSDETIKRFRLGYAPNGNVLKTKFVARGVAEGAKGEHIEDVLENALFKGQELLGKHLKLFTDKVDVSGGLQISVINEF